MLRPAHDSCISTPYHTRRLRQAGCSTTAYRIRVPLELGAVIVQRSKGGGRGGSWQERGPAQVVVCGAWVDDAVVVVVEGVQVACTEALPKCQSPLLVGRRGHQPCGPAAEVAGWGGGGGGRSCGGVLIISVKLSSVAGSFEM